MFFNSSIEGFFVGGIGGGLWEERGVIMEQNTLNVHVSNLKKALKAEGSCIETVHNIGYRWNQPVEKGERRMLQEEEKDCCKS